jgi:hypothetical protein
MDFEDKSLAWKRDRSAADHRGDRFSCAAVGGSNTSYAVVGIGDFFGNSTDDILFRNNSTGDTWIEAIGRRVQHQLRRRSGR